MLPVPLPAVVGGFNPYVVSADASTLTDMLLNKRERNRLYQIIEEANFDPGEFDLENQDGEATLSHNSGSRFEYLTRRRDQKLIELGLGEIEYEYRFSVVEGNSKTGDSSSIDFISKFYIPEWLKEIRLTVGVADYWDEMKHKRQLLAEVQAGSDNTPFALAEQRQIAAQLQEIRKQVKEQFELTGGQIARLDERLDEAAKASERMGRKDWLLLFAGTILSLILTDILTPAVAEHVFTAVLTALAHLFTGSGGEPPQILS